MIDSSRLFVATDKVRKIIMFVVLAICFSVATVAFVPSSLLAESPKSNCASLGGQWDDAKQRCSYGAEAEKLRSAAKKACQDLGGNWWDDDDGISVSCSWSHDQISKEDCAKAGLEYSPNNGGYCTTLGKSPSEAGLNGMISSINTLSGIVSTTTPTPAPTPTPNPTKDNIEKICNDPSNADSSICKDLKKDGEEETTNVAQNVINLLIFACGIVAVVAVIISGMRFASAHGDSNAVTKARTSLIYSVVGLIIAVFAFAIVNFIFARLDSGGGSSGGGGGCPTGTTWNATTGQCEGGSGGPVAPAPCESGKTWNATTGQCE